MNALPAPPCWRRWALALAALGLLLLGGCSSQELYSQLSERQANEMVAALRSAGIDAEKKSQEGRFSVTTGRSDFPRAVQVLNAQGLPREAFDSMGKIFKREGFVSSPLEEHARLNHAMSQEISNTLGGIDGVISARVHLVVPERNPLADKPMPARASVVIKHRPDKDLAAQTTQIKALVVNSVEGLAYENVTVALFPADALPGATPAADTPATRSAMLEAPLLSGGLVGAAALGGGGLLWWRRRTAAREPLLTTLPALAPANDEASDFDARLRRNPRVPD